MPFLKTRSGDAFLTLGGTCLSVQRQMRGFVLLSVIGVLAFLLIGLCLPGQVLTPHLEGPDGCCGHVQCYVLAVSVFLLGLWIVVMFLWPTTRVLVRSAIQQPIAPPPELILRVSA